MTASLPHREITEAELDNARRLAARLEGTGQARDLFNLNRAKRTIRRYEEQQQKGPLAYEMRLQAVRLGDVAIVTNDFELFTDFGVQMKARSPALQTFAIELCGGGTYIPTERAAQAGGYSAVAESNTVGHQGGQVLVEETLKLIESLFISAIMLCAQRSPLPRQTRHHISWNSKSGIP